MKMSRKYNRIIKYKGSSDFHTNLRKMQAFRKVAFEAWEAKDYDKAIEFINYAIDFCEHDNNREVLEEWDLVRIYATKGGSGDG